MRTRLASALAALALALAAGAAPSRALAQRDTIPRPPVPAPRDTTPRRPPRDSAQVAIPGEAVRGDTLPGAKGDTTKVDTTAAAPTFPVHPLPPAHGFSDGAVHAASATRAPGFSTRRVSRSAASPSAISM